MKIVVPLKNLVTDENFILNDIQFISTFSTEVYLSNLSIREDYEKNKNTVLPYLIGFELEWYHGKTLAIIESSEINEGEIICSHDQLIVFAHNITEKINRTLDLIRIMQCNITEQEKLPSYPGICLDGFSSILLVNEQNKYIPFVYRVQKLSFVEGLGLYLEDVSDYDNDPLYNILFKNEPSYISNIISQAVKRLNEAMYIPDPNSQFVYLMSTLEVICSPEYIGFSEVRQRIAAIVCSSKDSYLKMGEKLKELSEVYRTNIIHNGKDMFNNEFEKKKGYLIFLQEIIVNCVYKLIESEARSEEEFHEYIERKKTLLGVQPNQKIDKEKLVGDILKSYNEHEFITFNYNEWTKILNNLNKKFLSEILSKNVIKS